MSEVLAQLEKKGSSGGAVTYLGTGTSFNLTGYAGYQSFTVDNFIVEGDGSADSGYNSSETQVNACYMSSRVVIAATKTYNASTGILTAYINGTGYARGDGKVNSKAKQLPVKAYLVK